MFVVALVLILCSLYCFVYLNTHLIKLAATSYMLGGGGIMMACHARGNQLMHIVVEFVVFNCFLQFF